MCNFHGLKRNGETVFYTFNAQGRSRNPTTYKKVRKTAICENT